jgi:acyl-CoA synthetase (AMP-forming)/AMP-acid ligase II
MSVREVQSPAHLSWPGFPGVPDEVVERLMGPGAPFEMEVEWVGRRRLEVFVRRPRTLRQMLDETVDSRPDLPFLVAPERTWSFAEGRVEIDAIAALLADEYGIGRGDRVAIVAANSPEYGLVMWATLSLGAVVSSLNGWWTGPELEYGIELSSPKLLAGDAPRLARLEDGAVPPDVPVCRLDELRREALQRPLPSGPPVVEVVEDDPAVILFTSGTTGRPKGATLSHRNIINFVMTGKLGTAMGEMFVPASAGAQPATLLASPMFHVSGMLAILMSGGGLGAKLVFPPPGRWDPTAYLDLTVLHGISTWTGVPTQFWRLLRHEHLDDYDLHCVTTVGSGGAPFPPELVRSLTERMPWATLSNGYGMSETVGIGTRVVGQTMVAHPDSVGPANIGTEVEVREVGGGAVVSEGEVGEIYLRSPSVFLGYWDNPRATSDCLDAEGWYRTGDFGRIQDGMLYLDSRMRDMVLRGGENIYPIEIEHRLVEHPEIDDAAVIGVDHPELGQEVKAFVVRSAGSTLSERDVQEWAARSLASFKVPAHVEFRDSLPYTETGKVLKHELEREERSLAR